MAETPQLSRRGLLKGLSAFAPIAFIAPMAPAIARIASLDLAPVKHKLISEFKINWEQIGTFGVDLANGPDMTLEAYYQSDATGAWQAWKDRQDFNSYLRDSLWPHAEFEAQRMGLDIDSWSQAKVEEWELARPEIVGDRSKWPTTEMVTRALAEEKGRFVQEFQDTPKAIWHQRAPQNWPEGNVAEVDNQSDHPVRLEMADGTFVDVPPNSHYRFPVRRIKWRD